MAAKTTGRARPATKSAPRAAKAGKPKAPPRADRELVRHRNFSIFAVRASLHDTKADAVAARIIAGEDRGGSLWLELGQRLEKALFDPRLGRDRVSMQHQPRVYRDFPGLERLAAIDATRRSQARRMYLLDAEWSRERGLGENRKLPGLRHPEIAVRPGSPSHTLSLYRKKLKAWGARHGVEVGPKTRQGGARRPVGTPVAGGVANGASLLFSGLKVGGAPLDDASKAALGCALMEALTGLKGGDLVVRRTLGTWADGRGIDKAALFSAVNRATGEAAARPGDAQGSDAA